MSQESSSSGSDIAEQVVMIASSADNIEQMETGDHWQQLVRLVSQRIVDSHLQCDAQVQNVLSRMIVDEQATEQENLERVQLLHDVAVNSGFTNNVELMARTNCILDTQEDYNGARFYVRSQHLTKDQLEATLRIYEDQYADMELCNTFRERLLTGTRLPVNIFIHYVGCTIATTPQMRMETDLGSDDPNRLNNFTEAMRQANIDPDFQVFEFPTLRIDPDEDGQVNQDMVDVTEQILIHLFDRALLLNSQPGGFYRDYLPLQEDLNATGLADQQQYVQTRELFFGQQPVSDQAVANVRALYHNRYRTQLTRVDEARARQIANLHIDLFSRQAASGASLGGIRPLFIFAKDITREDLKYQRGFFEGSRSGRITRDLIAHAFGSFEERETFNAPSFHDLWPCKPIPRQQQNAWIPFMETSVSILQHIDPMVVATLGFDPAAVSFSCFRSSYSLATTEFLDNIGTPFISNSDLEFDYESNEDAQPGSQVLVIPHLHPGFVSYGPADPRILRLMLLCWIRTFVLIDCCYEELQDPETPNERGTADFCQRVLERLTTREQDTGFLVRLAASKTAVQQYLHERGTSQSAAAIRRAEIRGDPEPGMTIQQVNANMAAVVQAKIDRYGLASGAKNSQARIQQARNLERHRYPEMRGLPSFRQHMASTPAQQTNSEWRNWFLNLEPGVSIFHAVIGRKGWEVGEILSGLTRRQTRAARRITTPPSTWQGTGDEWLNDPEMVVLAISEDMSRMAANRNPRIRDETRERLRQASLSNTNRDVEVIDVFSNSLVRVMGNGRCVFSVYTAENQTHQVSDPTGLWFGKRYAHQRLLLDYDPTISRHAVVVKDLNENVVMDKGQPKLFYDWYFLWHLPATYYKAFERTVLDTRNVLRFEIVNELALPDDQRFSFNRLLLILFERMIEEQGVPFAITSRDDVPSPDRRGNPVPAGIRQIIRGIAEDTGYRGMERLVWEYHLEENLLPITTIMRQMADVVTTKRSYMIGNLQVEYYLYTITPHQQQQQQ
ncbi:hypothetical protein K492DRAFT_192142 [Lichtheimia hyalospora FSU 10163]|nr:hypothetical protein K492DRAFT_192142 [Lichtheimia hyalospora FSU 10163]